MTQAITRWTVTAVVGVMVTAAHMGAQDNAETVLTRARAALGGEARLAAIKTLSVTGRTVRQRDDATTAEHEFEMAFEAPGRFVRRSVVMAMGPTSIYRHSGFDGATPIDWIDTPPVLAGGANVVIRMNWQGPDGDAPSETPEQAAERSRRTLSLNQQDFARLALGLFANAPASYPLRFTHAGTAESLEGRADVVSATGPDGFAANLFIDQTTHMPLMVSWQAPKPLEIVSSSGPGEMRVERRIENGRTLDSVTPAAADAARPLVEHRLVFADYKTFDGGVKLPTRLQRLIDGRTVEETTFDRVRVNQRLDSRTFATGN